MNTDRTLWSLNVIYQTEHIVKKERNYFCNEMGVRQEKLLRDIHNGEDGGHLVSEAMCRGFRDCLRVCSLGRTA